MKKFHYTNKTETLKREIISFNVLVSELDTKIKSLYDSISVSKADFVETRDKFNKMRELEKEREKYRKKIEDLNKELKTNH